MGCVREGRVAADQLDLLLERHLRDEIVGASLCGLRVVSDELGDGRRGCREQDPSGDLAKSSSNKARRHVEAPVITNEGTSNTFIDLPDEYIGIGFEHCRCGCGLTRLLFVFSQLPGLQLLVAVLHFGGSRRLLSRARSLSGSKVSTW